ncbi:hypothetical protein Micbo1qcDRAFT_177127 [Microdochium bolleyi]|uniref:BTB domain-containing protein n=1 Tax=Microdochium bolleyi TaxID=196109 RepID=A0A136IY80_9PEZI|nr:hypothetical protein Micbo1qcDRAFT_177127 [Microdochium bolleyi]
MAFPGTIVPPEFEKLIIDRRGDLWICAGTADGANVSLIPGRDVSSPTWAFRVCSRTLARCSPVFAAMFFDEDGDPQTLQYYNMRLAHLWQADVEALSVLLQLIHGCNGDDFIARATRDKNFDKALYQLTILTDKYSCTAVLRPIVDRCVVITELDARTSDDVPQLQRVAWIAWELGHLDTLQQCAERLMYAFSPEEATEEALLKAGLAIKEVPELRGEFLLPITYIAEQFC